MATGRGDAAEDGDLGDGRKWQILLRDTDLHVGDESDLLGLTWGSIWRPWDSKRGRVR
jgi:hypothetical protein